MPQPVKFFPWKCWVPNSISRTPIKKQSPVLSFCLDMVCWLMQSQTRPGSKRGNLHPTSQGEQHQRISCWFRPARWSSIDCWNDTVQRWAVGTCRAVGKPEWTWTCGKARGRIHSRLQNFHLQWEGQGRSVQLSLVHSCSKRTHIKVRGYLADTGRCCTMPQLWRGSDYGWPEYHRATLGGGTILDAWHRTQTGGVRGSWFRWSTHRGWGARLSF